MDDLLVVQVVTANGEVVHVTHYRDLFWAIRGGRGNFGVSRDRSCAGHAIDTIVGGVLVLPGTPDPIASFVEE